MTVDLDEDQNGLPDEHDAGARYSDFGESCCVRICWKDSIQNRGRLLNGKDLDGRVERVVVVVVGGA